MAIMQFFFRILPFIFGIAFLAPLFAEIIVRIGMTPPLDMTPIAWGLIIGGAWGLIATSTGRWI